jgi:maleate isomerase
MTWKPEVNKLVHITHYPTQTKLNRKFAYNIDKDQSYLIEHLPFSTHMVIGEKARIGLVVLATDYTVEHEFRQIITEPGIDVFAARIANEVSVTPKTLSDMGPRITDTASLILPEDRLDVLAYGCTSASTVLGEAAVHGFLKAAKPMAKTTTPITAAFAAFQTMQAKRIAVLTPYRSDVNAIVYNYITQHGFEVPVFGSFNEEKDPIVASIDADSLISAINTIKDKAARDGESIDMVFVSCTSVRLAEHVAQIEQSIGLPVTSSNHAMAWHCLRLAGMTDAQPHLGQLYNAQLP